MVTQEIKNKMFDKYCEQRSYGVSRKDIFISFVLSNAPAWVFVCIPAWEQMYQESL